MSEATVPLLYALWQTQNKVSLCWVLWGPTDF